MTLNGEGPEVIARLAPYLQCFYVSNSVPGKGDVQPRFGLADSKVDSRLLTRYMHALAAVEFAGPLAVAVRPVDSEVPENVVSVALSLMNEAANTVDVSFVLPLGFAYRSRDFFNEETFAEMTELRVQKPNLAKEELAKRKRREVLAPDGKLVILAADHPGRSVSAPDPIPVPWAIVSITSAGFYAVWPSATSTA